MQKRSNLARGLRASAFAGASSHVISLSIHFLFTTVFSLRVDSRCPNIPQTSLDADATGSTEIVYVYRWLACPSRGNEYDK